MSTQRQKAAVSKVEDSFDVDMAGIGIDVYLEAHDILSRPIEARNTPVSTGLNFSVEQLEAMLAIAKSKEAGNA